MNETQSPDGVLPFRIEGVTDAGSPVTLEVTRAREHVALNRRRPIATGCERVDGVILDMAGVESLIAWLVAWREDMLGS